MGLTFFSSHFDAEKNKKKEFLLLTLILFFSISRFALVKQWNEAGRIAQAWTQNAYKQIRAGRITYPIKADLVPHSINGAHILNEGYSYSLAHYYPELYDSYLKSPESKNKFKNTFYIRGPLKYKKLIAFKKVEEGLLVSPRDETEADSYYILADTKGQKRKRLKISDTSQSFLWHDLY